MFDKLVAHHDIKRIAFEFQSRRVALANVLLPFAGISVHGRFRMRYSKPPLAIVDAVGIIPALEHGVEKRGSAATDFEKSQR